jgi:hypothetical protein
LVTRYRENVAATYLAGCALAAFHNIIGTLGDGLLRLRLACGYRRNVGETYFTGRRLPIALVDEVEVAALGVIFNGDGLGYLSARRRQGGRPFRNGPHGQPEARRQRLRHACRRGRSRSTRSHLRRGRPWIFVSTAKTERPFRNQPHGQPKARRQRPHHACGQARSWRARWQLGQGGRLGEYPVSIMWGEGCISEFIAYRRFDGRPEARRQRPHHACGQARSWRARW